MATARKFGSWICLAPAYALGWSAGSVVMLGATAWAAMVLGWSDARKRGDRGVG